MVSSHKAIAVLKPKLAEWVQSALCVHKDSSDSDNFDAVADPGFLRGRQPRGRQPIIWPIFPENCMKIKKFWARGVNTATVLESFSVKLVERPFNTDVSLRVVLV